MLAYDPSFLSLFDFIHWKMRWWKHGCWVLWRKEEGEPVKKVNKKGTYSFFFWATLLIRCASQRRLGDSELVQRAVQT